VYAVFSNEQLAQIVSRQCQSLADLAQIEGVGQARVDKYGSAILACAATQRALPHLLPIQPAGAA
jgi:superfamily II DNA helicase RecQ